MDPNAILIFTESRDGNIDLVIPPTRMRPFVRFHLAFIRCHFADIKTTALSAGVNAPMTLHVDSESEQSTEGPWDTKLFELGEYGFGFDLSASVEAGDIPRMIIRAGWGMRVSWTNPQSGDIAWGMEYGIVPLDTPRGSV